MPMSTGFRKTAEGVELTVRTLKALGWLAIALVGAVTYAVRARGQIVGAVQHQEFMDTTRMIRADLKTLATDVKSALATSNSVACYNAKYPAGLCDNVPRAMQAGSPVRRTP